MLVDLVLSHTVEESQAEVTWKLCYRNHSTDVGKKRNTFYVKIVTSGIFFFFSSQIRLPSSLSLTHSEIPNLLSLRRSWDDTTTAATEDNESPWEILITHTPNPRRDLCAHSVRVSWGHYGDQGSPCGKSTNDAGTVDEGRNYTLGDTIRYVKLECKYPDTNIVQMFDFYCFHRQVHVFVVSPAHGLH